MQPRTEAFRQFQYPTVPLAVYPEEVIGSHRAFIARRREERPSAEYRTPTDAEWDEFLGHFEHRKVALGDCGRAYGTGCIHEHDPLTELTEGASGLRPRSTDSDVALSPGRFVLARYYGWWSGSGVITCRRSTALAEVWMPEKHSTTIRDVGALAVARNGRVEETGDPLAPFRLVDEQGTEVPAVTEFLHHMLADDASPASLRSYAYELLAWVRFLDAVGVAWDLAGRAEARDFALWLKAVRKPARHRRPGAPAPGSVNPVTGKAAPGENYAARTRRHARAVIRSFYEYHREMHGRPLVNPFPQAKGAEDGQPNAHRNPMQPFRQPARRAAYQPKEPKPAPRSIPDYAFNGLFAGLACNRDRALIAFYISTGARASELLGAHQGLVAPED
jgi:hypothetical protein